MFDPTDLFTKKAEIIKEKKKDGRKETEVPSGQNSKSPLKEKNSLMTEQVVSVGHQKRQSLLYPQE